MIDVIGSVMMNLGYAGWGWRVWRRVARREGVRWAAAS